MRVEVRPGRDGLESLDGLDGLEMSALPKKKTQRSGETTQVFRLGLTLFIHLFCNKIPGMQ